MDSLETAIHSFIVRIWLEESLEESGHARWRGHITHVPSGKRVYFEELDRIQSFITLYLEQMGAGLGRTGRVRQWLLRLCRQMSRA